MAQEEITYPEKENNRPIVDRDKQATAEDFNEIKSVVNANAYDVTLKNPIKLDISAPSTVIPISPELTGTIYEIEIVGYTQTGENFGNSNGLAEVTSKGIGSFTLEIPSGYETGTLIYRILDFNL